MLNGRPSSSPNGVVVSELANRTEAEAKASQIIWIDQENCNLNISDYGSMFIWLESSIYLLQG